MFVDAGTIETWDFADTTFDAKPKANIATALIWLKNDARDMQGQIVGLVKGLKGVENASLRSEQPSVLKVSFNFNQIRYAEIIHRINLMGYNARVVGY